MSATYYSKKTATAISNPKNLKRLTKLDSYIKNLQEEDKNGTTNKL